MDIELMMQGFLIAWLITNFQPIQDGLNALKLPNWIKYILSAFQCFKCTAMWLTWALTGDVFSAIAVSLIASTYDRLMSALPMKL